MSPVIFLEIIQVFLICWIASVWFGVFWVGFFFMCNVYLIKLLSMESYFTSVDLLSTGGDE